MKKLAIILALGLLVCAIYPLVTQADILTEGSSGGPDAYDMVSYFSGTLPTATIIPYSTSSFSGQIAYAAGVDKYGNVDFLYQVNASSGAGVVAIAAGSFAGYTTDIGYSTTGSLFSGSIYTLGTLENPGTVSLSGGDVSWSNYPTGDIAVDPGEASPILFVITDAPAYSLSGSVSVQDSVNFSTFADAPVPEPATMLLLGSGLIGMGVYARKRFAKK